MKIIEVEKIESHVKATLKHEGLKASKEGEKITRKYLNGLISSDEAITSIKNLYLNKKDGVKND